MLYVHENSHKRQTHTANAHSVAEHSMRDAHTFTRQPCGSRAPHSVKEEEGPGAAC